MPIENLRLFTTISLFIYGDDDALLKFYIWKA